MFRLFHVFIIIFSSNIVVLLSATTKCQRSSECKGMEIRYPFWDNSSYPQNCGYPGLHVIDCPKETVYPVVNVLNDLYELQSIDYKNQSLYVANLHLSTQACPRPRSNFTLIKSTNLVQLSLDPSTHYVLIFYNCSSYPPKYKGISCLSKTSKRSFAFFKDKIPKFNWYGNCEKTVEMPTGGELGIVDGILNDDTYPTPFQAGFRLRWSPPNRNCSACERSGGKCWYNQTATNDFRCLCHGKLRLQNHCPRSVGLTKELTDIIGAR